MFVVRLQVECGVIRLTIDSKPACLDCFCLSGTILFESKISRLGASLGLPQVIIIRLKNRG